MAQKAFNLTTGSNWKLCQSYEQCKVLQLYHLCLSTVSLFAKCVRDEWSVSEQERSYRALHFYEYYEYDIIWILQFTAAQKLL